MLCIDTHEGKQSTRSMAIGPDEGEFPSSRGDGRDDLGNEQDGLLLRKHDAECVVAMSQRLSAITT